jgi:hypothetical protein
MRFEMQLSCRLKRQGTYEMIDATTLNLGRMGALIVTGTSSYTDLKALPQTGDPVRLEVVLPEHQNFGPRCLACDAVAVRSTHEGGACLVALQFERVEIRRILARSAAVSRLGVM